MKIDVKTLLIAMAVVLLLFLANILFPPRSVKDIELQKHEETLTSVRNMDLGLLHTVKMKFDVMIDYRTHQPNWFLAVDHVLDVWIFLKGEVKAGVDLNEVSGNDIFIFDTDEGTSVILMLPHAEIQYISSLQRVWEDRTFEVRGQYDSEPNLVTDVKNEIIELAEDSLRTLALEYGILKAAEDNVRISLTAMLLSLGFKDPHVYFKDLP